MIELTHGIRKVLSAEDASVIAEGIRQVITAPVFGRLSL